MSADGWTYSLLGYTAPSKDWGSGVGIPLFFWIPSQTRELMLRPIHEGPRPYQHIGQDGMRNTIFLRKEGYSRDLSTSTHSSGPCYVIWRTHLGTDSIQLGGRLCVCSDRGLPRYFGMKDSGGCCVRYRANLRGDGKIWLCLDIPTAAVLGRWSFHDGTSMKV